MAGPALALQFILILAFLFFLIFLLIYSIVKRSSLKKSIPSLLLFIVLTSFATYIYYFNRRNEYELSKKFLGDYKLKMLDRKKCDSCKVRLYEGYTYDIIVKNKIVGHGNWNIETAIDIPGYFLKIDKCPNSVIWEHDRIIEYLDRTKQ